MLQIILAWIYISVLCWTWGHTVIRLLTNATSIQEYEQPNFSLTCLAGLSILASIGALLSLFMPLGGLIPQIIMLAPALLVWITDKRMRTQLVESLKKLANSYTAPSTILLILLLILLLQFGASVMNHPDSIGYHIQTIKWIEEYKVIPGLVHLHTPLGYQGFWYCLCALFSFRFTHTPAVSFINTTILFWYLLFIIHQINAALKSTDKRQKISGILFFALLLVSYSSYTQVRLTATSASPDFIASLYAWAIIYLIIQDDVKTPRYVNIILIGLLSPVAISIKLSSIPVVLFLFYSLYRLMLLQKRKSALLLLSFAFFTMSIFCTRSAITTGYLIFPSPFPDLLQVDWKMSKEATVHEKEYITSFARTASESVNQSSLVSESIIPTWLAVWWRIKSFADKIILISLACTLILVLINAKKIFNNVGKQHLIAIAVSILALIFWFLEAPDPRFGFGFIIPIQGIVLSFLLSPYAERLSIVGKNLPIGIAIFGCVALGYNVYRFKKYFSPEFILQPAGTEKIKYKTVYCGQIPFHIPIDNGCGSTPLPCTYYNDCSQFASRGNSITDGFKRK